MMFDTSGELVAWFASWPKELWSGLGSFAIAAALAVMAKISGKRADADKAAQPVTPPEMAPADPTAHGLPGMTFLRDAETERDMLVALREAVATLEGIHNDQVAWYNAENARRASEEHRRLTDENVDLKEELAKLRAGQLTTHGNQGKMRSEVAKTDRMIAALLRKLDVDPEAV